MTAPNSITASARAIIDKAIAEHEPVAIFVLFSGGDDSLALTHLAMEHLGDRASVVHLDTGIGVPETREFVEWFCDAAGYGLLVYSAMEHCTPDGTPDPQCYEDLVIPPAVRAGELDPHERGGFPGPGRHQVMFDRLKGRSIQRLVRDHKTSREDRVMLISGVRSSESTRRMPLAKTGPVNRNGAQLWVNPLLSWSDQDCITYRELHRLPQNPVSELLGMSGECLCGAFAKPHELETIEIHYPEVGARIRALEIDAFEHGYCWGWDGRPPKTWCMEKHGQQRLPGMEMMEAQACASCFTRQRLFEWVERLNEREDIRADDPVLRGSAYQQWLEAKKEGAA